MSVVPEKHYIACSTRKSAVESLGASKTGSCRTVCLKIDLHVALTTSRLRLTKPSTPSTRASGGSLGLPQQIISTPESVIARDQAGEDRTQTSEIVDGQGTAVIEPEGVGRVAHPQDDHSPSQFSLQTVLSTSLDLRQLMFKQPVSTEQDSALNALLGRHVATSLFHGFVSSESFEQSVLIDIIRFMTSINPLICLLDPDLHTFQYVKERSTFLLAAILSAAAKAFNPPLHVTLYEFAEDLLCDSFRRGIKSTEAVQAIMIFTYWKKSPTTLVLGHQSDMQSGSAWSSATTA